MSGFRLVNVNILSCEMHLYTLTHVYLSHNNNYYVFSFSIILSNLNCLGDALQELDEDLNNDSQLLTDSEEDMFFWSVKIKCEVGYVICCLRTNY